MFHKPVIVAAQGPGAAIQLLATLLLLPAERGSALEITAQKGELELQTNRKQDPFLGLAFTSGFPKEKSDQALEGMEVLQGIWTVTGRRGFRVGNYPNLQEREILVQIKNALTIPSPRTPTPSTHITLCQSPQRQYGFSCDEV